jgi:hypothetical protein
MKKRVTLIVLVFAFTICCNSNGIASAKKIMAHYMPWYQSQPFSGSWGWHWTMANINHQFYPPATFASHYYPLFGLYDSKDPHLLASQALLMKFAGIDGIIADWYGIECFNDYCRIKDATNLFIPYVKEAGLEFSICYEDRTIQIMHDDQRSRFYQADRATLVAHGVEVMQWLEDNYFTDPCYTKIDNRPVLLNFGPIFFTSSEWTTLFSGLSPKPQFFPYRTSYVAARTGGFDWPVPQNGTVTGHLDEFYYWAGGWAHYIAGAFPRFKDIYQEAGLDYWYPDIDAQGSYGSYGTSTYSYTLERGLQSTADIVQLVTWNDYGEGTIIEPTEEDGYLYLEMTQELRKEYIDANFPYVAADLRLPVRLYTLRKENLGNPAIMAQLATVEDYLFANNLSGAKELLDQIECSALHVFTSAWLSVPGDGDWNPACDFSQPTDNIIDFQDFAVFAQNWLNETL